MEPPAELQPKQFSLRQIFAWTTTAAMVAGVSNLAPGGLRMSTPELFVGAIAAIVFGQFVLLTVWATLGNSKPVRKLMLVAGADALLGVLVTHALPAFAAADPELILIGPASVLAVGAVLLLFRGFGFRYIRASNQIP